MALPPIPHRMPPLGWRKPAILWTPVALIVAIGWPALIFAGDRALQELALTVSAAVFALALVTLGASWLIARPPRTRRTVVMHVVVAGAIASLLAPLVVTHVVATVSDATHEGAAGGFSTSMAMALLPLALVLGLPAALISAIAFAWIALTRKPPPEPHDLLGDGVFSRDVQPFQ
jgi:hypothetical protein